MSIDYQAVSKTCVFIYFDLILINKSTARSLDQFN